VKFLDFFSGIGGFRLGMEMAGHECAGHVEIDKFANKSYAAMHNPKESEYFATDIRTVESDGLPDADCYCGGFPCQAFSIAGKRGGFEDMRGTLVFEVFRLASIKRPRLLFLENVEGLLNHDGGRTFRTIINAMDELGYDAEWQCINSRNYVPQNRERIFIIGHLRGTSRREVFPIRHGSQQALKQIIGSSQGNRVYDTDGISCTLASQAGGMGAKTGLYMMPAKINKMKNGSFCSIHEASLRDIGTETASTITARYYKGASGHGDNVVIIDKNGKKKNKDYASCLTGGGHSGGNHSDMDLIVQAVMITEATKQGYDIAHEGDSINLAVPGSQTRRGIVGKGIANTLDTGCNQGTLTQGRIRRLTPRECFRLQGFPDDYFDRAAQVNSDSQLYKQAGNSVTVNVIYEIAKRL
jgi:DNA (cytosine-5)-methyltransferase 1